MAYTKQTWIDDNESYPISAARLAHMEDGIGDVDERLTYVEANGGGTGDGTGGTVVSVNVDNLNQTDATMKTFLKSSGLANARLNLSTYSRAEITDLLAGKVDTNAMTLKADQTALDNLTATVNTNNGTAVKLTGAQTIAGVKTFSSAPVVPDASFTIAKTSNLQSALDNKASNSALSLKLDSSQRGVASGVAGLDANGDVVNAAGTKISAVTLSAIIGAANQAANKENARRALGIFTNTSGVFPTAADGASVGDIYISV